MRLYENFIKFLILFFPIFLIAGQMFAEIALLLVFFISIYTEYHKIKFDKFSNLFLILFIFLAFEILFIYQIYDFKSLKNLFLFRFVIFGLLVSIFFEKNKFIELFINFLTIIFVILLFDALYQFKFGENIIGIKTDTHYRIASFFGDEYILGSFVARLTPIILALSLFKFKGENYKHYIILVTCLLITIISGDRTSLIFSVSFICLHLILNYKKKSLILISGTIIIVILGILNITNLKERFFIKTYEQIIHNNKIIYITPFHHNYAQVSINMFKEKPFFGHGIKSFREKCSLEKYQSNTIKHYEKCSTHSHNYYLQFLSENGLINFFILLYIFFLSFFSFIKNFKLSFITNNYFNKSKSYIYLGMFINFFPLLPNGNFYNGWLLCILSLYIAVINFLEKN